MSGETATSTSVTTGPDTSARPFGYINPEGKTAMLCEQDVAVRDQIDAELKKLGYLVSQPASYRDALKQMRYHVFDVIFVSEDFDAEVSAANNVLLYLENMNMTTRRKSFVVLISAKLSTMDNMQAFHKSVNLIVNKQDIGNIEKILRQSIAEHDDFYRVFKEKLRRR